MAASGIAVLASTLLLICDQSFAATLNSATESLVRRERMSGQLSARSVPSLQYAKTDYLLGKEGKNECRHRENETVIGANEDECKDAAHIVGAHVDVEHVFRIGDAPADHDDTKIYPVGCFYKKCVKHGAPAGSPEVDCFFYNMGDASLSMTDETLAAQFSGKPVCKRPKYEYGPAGGQGCLHDEFKVVDSLGECREQCGYHQHAGCTDDDFIIADAKNFTRHHDFPKGCFNVTMDKDGGGAMNTVFYNDYPDANKLADHSVSGTPICKVKDPLQLSEA